MPERLKIDGAPKRISLGILGSEMPTRMREGTEVIGWRGSGSADLLADDVVRLLCYRSHIPRSLMVDYLKVLRVPPRPLLSPPAQAAARTRATAGRRSDLRPGSLISI